ncbi:MAG: hypothetical protein C4289_10265, partial [Chloroflexota bacterium]
MARQSLEERFWSKVEKSDGCWRWMGAQGPSGRGHFRIGSKMVYAHRVAYELIHGPIPAGAKIVQMCEDLRCVRPDHLLLRMPTEGLRPLAIRFWAKVQKTDGCWYWLGQVNKDGYGYLGVGSKLNGTKRLVKAHRVVFELAFGPIPEGLEVCHHCDEPRCVRPDHLFLGTHADNMVDAFRKGRLKQLSCKLTPDQVVEIRQEAANGVPFVQI